METFKILLSLLVALIGTVYYIYAAKYELGKSRFKETWTIPQKIGKISIIFTGWIVINLVYIAMLSVIKGDDFFSNLIYVIILLFNWCLSYLVGKLLGTICE